MNSIKMATAGMAVSMALLAAGVAAPAQAQAQERPPAQSVLDSSLVVNVGSFILNTDLTGRLDGSSTTNPDVDFDRAFGRDNDATRIRADLLWRITPRQHLRVLYFDNHRTASRVIDRPIEWGDYSFTVGGNVNADTKFRIGEVAYEYAFKHEPTYELAASVGVHYAGLKVTLSGAATVTDANGTATELPAAIVTKNVPAPLPVVGLRGGWAVSPHWYLDAQAQYFSMKMNGYDGYVSDLRAGASWMYSRHVGIGLGYNRFVTNIDVSRDNFDGRLRFGYSGLLLYLTGAF
jgi:hypothetical protein